MTRALEAVGIVVWLLYAIVVAIAPLSTLDFLLRLVGADSDNGLVTWVNRSTDTAMQPLRASSRPATIALRYRSSGPSARATAPAG